MQAALKEHKPSHQEYDMLWSLADFRAKVQLLQERGFLGYERYTVMDDNLFWLAVFN